MQQGPLDALLARPTPTLQVKAQPVGVKRAISATALRDAIHALQTHPRRWEALSVCVNWAFPATGPQVARRARQGSIGAIQASRAQAPAHAARMAPPRVPSRMGQATTVTARPALGSSPAVIPQTSRLPSCHLSRRVATTMSPSANAHQQVARREGNWQGSREAP